MAKWKVRLEQQMEPEIDFCKTDIYEAEIEAETKPTLEQFTDYMNDNDLAPVEVDQSDIGFDLLARVAEYYPVAWVETDVKLSVERID